MVSSHITYLEIPEPLIYIHLYIRVNHKKNIYEQSLLGHGLLSLSKDNIMSKTKKLLHPGY